MLAWGLVLVQDINVHIDGYQLQKGEIFSPFMGIIFCAITILVLGILIAYPLEFKFYAILCCLHGLISIIDGGSSPGFLMYLLGIVFAFHARFFKKYRDLKIVVLLFFPVLALVSQIRFGLEKAVISALNILALTLIFALAYLLFLPDIRKLRRQNLGNTNVAYLPSELFSEKDIRCLKRVQNGEKYTSIVTDEDIGLSTLKNRMMTIYKSLGVDDKTSFMKNYAGYTFLLKSSK
jgi:glucan phosphoethanolaminetransferase (alkaline phosphatase superfamily)